MFVTRTGTRLGPRAIERRLADWYWGSYHWYTFNVADAAITSGAALLILHSFLPQGGDGADAGAAGRS